jgi:hypothetical protein
MSNTTTICGNLTREPEIRYTKEGQATTQLGVAVNRRWQDKTSGEWQEATSFFDVPDIRARSASSPRSRLLVDRCPSVLQVEFAAAGAMSIADGVADTAHDPARGEHPIHLGSWELLEGPRQPSADFSPSREILGEDH